MRVKKPLLLVAFTLLLVVLVLGITGLAVAAPATAVKGSLTYVSDEMISVVPDEDGSVAITMRFVWMLDGDLVGEYALTATWYARDAPRYFIRGQATFTGTLKGEPANWSANVNGSGKMHLGYEFAGKQLWKSTLVSGGKGQITVRDRYGHWDGTDYTVYTGELK